jgi:hypothetical protein
MAMYTKLMDDNKRRDQDGNAACAQAPPIFPDIEDCVHEESGPPLTHEVSPIASNLQRCEDVDRGHARHVSSSSTPAVTSKKYVAATNEEEARLKIDHLQKLLTSERQNRQTLESGLRSAMDQVASLKARLLTNDEEEEDTQTVDDFDRIVTDKVNERLAIEMKETWDEFDARLERELAKAATIVSAKHSAELAASSVKYNEMCKEVERLHAELQENQKSQEEGNNEMDAPGTGTTVGDTSPCDTLRLSEMTPARGNAEYKKKCAAVKRLEAEVSAAHVALDTALSRLVQKRTLRGKKNLSQKIISLAQKYEKVAAEHTEMSKEKLEYEQTLEETRMALEESNETALQRERAEANEKLAMATSELEDHIVRLSRQLKAAEALVRDRPAASTPCQAILAPTLSPTSTPNVFPTPVSGATVAVDEFKPSPNPNIDNAPSIPLRATPTIDATTSGDSYEYIDALDANPTLIHQRHLHTYNYILSRNDENHSNIEELVSQPYMCRWPQEWTNKVEALRKYKGQGWEEDVRMMNCIKMYGLSKAEDGSLIVQDHKSTGEPFLGDEQLP